MERADLTLAIESGTQVFFGVLNGGVVTQRCGGGLTEAELDAYLSDEPNDETITASAKVRAAVLNSRTEKAA